MCSIADEKNNALDNILRGLENPGKYLSPSARDALLACPAAKFLFKRGGVYEEWCRAGIANKGVVLATDAEYPTVCHTEERGGSVISSFGGIPRIQIRRKGVRSGGITSWGQVGYGLTPANVLAKFQHYFPLRSADWVRLSTPGVQLWRKAITCKATVVVGHTYAYRPQDYTFGAAVLPRDYLLENDKGEHWVCEVSAILSIVGNDGETYVWILPTWFEDMGSSSVRQNLPLFEKKAGPEPGDIYPIYRVSAAVTMVHQCKGGSSRATACIPTPRAMQKGDRKKVGNMDLIHNAQNRVYGIDDCDRDAPPFFKQRRENGVLLCHGGTEM